MKARIVIPHYIILLDHLLNEHDLLGSRGEPYAFSGYEDAVSYAFSNLRDINFKIRPAKSVRGRKNET